MTDAGGWYAIGLTVKSGTRPSDLTTESLYKTGNLFRIDASQPADDGYLVCAEVEKRVKSFPLFQGRDTSLQPSSRFLICRISKPT